MSQDRKAKRKKREEKERRALERKRELFDRALAHAGLTAAFERCRADLREAMRQQAVLPVPQMVFDPSVAAMPDAIAIQQRFDELLEKPVATAGSLTPLEVLCVLWTLHSRIERTAKQMRERGENARAEPWAGMFAFGKELGKDLERYQRDVAGTFYCDLWAEILTRSVVDERVFWFDFQSEPTLSKKKFFARYVLKVMKPERTRIICDGGARSAFRASMFSPMGLELLTWKATDLGFDGEPQEYPVYVQSHVLEQLARRIPSYHTPAIVCSLTRPKFVRQSADSFLVEYRQGAADHKLGYFVGVRLPDKVLLKTFLFLTMQGTPESDLLYSKLRLTRRDIEFMRLDDLSVFLDRDVRQDAGLVRLFDECGCGHLLKAADPDLGSEGRHGHAEQLRKYLGNVDRFISRFAPSQTV